MATRSTIAVQHADGRVSQIYVHWDGYLEHNGRILFEHYNTLDKVEKLVSLGDISVLAENIEPFDDQPEHSFDHPQCDVTIYYGRDRGEQHCEPMTVIDYDTFIACKNSEEYDYYFNAGKWYLLANERKGGTKLIEITAEMVGIKPSGLVPVQHYTSRFMMAN